MSNIAISVTPTKICNLLEKFGMHDKATWFAENIGEIGYKDGAFHFEFKGGLNATVPVKMGVVDKILTNELSSITTNVIKAQFVVMFKNLGPGKAQMEASEQMIDLGGEPPPPKATPDYLKPKPEQMAKKKTYGEIYGKEPEIKMEVKIPKTPKVHLKDATELLQPVHGTSADSTYFYIAGHGSLKLAIRIKGKNISFRAESHSMEMYKDYLKKVGMTPGDTGHYSCHFGVEDKEVMKRSIGAMLMGIGVPWHSVAFNVMEVAEQGT